VLTYKEHRINITAVKDHYQRRRQ